MKIKYYIYILEKLLTMPKKGNVKKNVSKQVKKLNNKKVGVGCFLNF